MRIIKEGTIPNIEYVFTCDYCGCEFAVTEGELRSSPFFEKESYRCPTCGKQVYGATPQEIDTTELPFDPLGR